MITLGNLKICIFQDVDLSKENFDEKIIILKPSLEFRENLHNLFSSNTEVNLIRPNIYNLCRMKIMWYDNRKDFFAKEVFWKLKIGKEKNSDLMYSIVEVQFFIEKEEIKKIKKYYEAQEFFIKSEEFSINFNCN